MRRRVKYPFLGLAIVLFCWINVPKALSDHFRSFAAGLFYRQGVLYDQRISQQVECLQKAERSAVKSLTGELSSLQAQVTYRDPSSWSSSLWVNVGEESNRAIWK